MKTRVYICYPFPQPIGYGVMGGFVEGKLPLKSKDLTTVECDNHMKFTRQRKSVYLNAGLSYEMACHLNKTERPAS